jgi:DNA-binding transcriptional regulator YdaS (Cro superfamily)
MESLRQKLDDGKEHRANEMHRMAAPQFAALCDGYGKRMAVAEFLGVSESHLSEMCAGTRAVPWWMAYALMSASVDSYNALNRPMCEKHDLSPPQARERQLTPQQQFALMLRFFQENPAALRWLTEVAYERHGASPEAVVRQVHEVDAK